MSKRIRGFEEVTESLAGLSDDELREAVTGSHVNWTAWAGHQRTRLGGHELFVKRVPLTRRELDAPGSTANLFGLPVFYNYGVGSAGFGAYRELHAHRLVTDLVLRGVTEGFPLLYHHRVLPRLVAPPPFPLERSRYLARWNNDATIAEYFDARHSATHELWLIAEHIPHELFNWQPANQNRTSEMVAALREAAAAMNTAGVVHFDAHSGNSLTDGDRFCVSDFGLALSDQFDLSAEERSFLGAHGHYDHAQIIWSLALPLAGTYGQLSPAEKARVNAGLGEPIDPATPGFLDAVLANLESVAEPLGLHADYAETLCRFRDVIIAMRDFILAISRPDKQARFDDTAMQALLASADAL